jgi:glutaredoxin 3
MDSGRVIVYSTQYCGYCQRAKQLLDRKKIPYSEIDVTNDTALREKMEAESGRRTVPQIFIDGKHIGGCDDLYELDRNGGLDTLL